MDLHENQCGQPKHEIDAAGWLRQKWEREEEEQRGMEVWREAVGAKEFTEVHQSGLLLSRAGLHEGVKVSRCGRENGENLVDVEMERCIKSSTNRMSKHYIVV